MNCPRCWTDLGNDPNRPHYEPGIDYVPCEPSPEEQAFKRELDYRMWLVSEAVRDIERGLKK
jgi:hypothetical protein